MAPVIKIGRKPTRSLEHVIGVIEAGKVVIVPTDTVYGLSAAVFRPNDIATWVPGYEPEIWSTPAAELYRLKKREREKPAIILAKDWTSAARLAAAPLEPIADFCRDVDAAVTAVVAARKSWGLPAVSPGGGVAIRVPAVGWIRELLAAVTYLYSISANVAGESAPTTADEVPPAISDGVALIVDGGPASALRPSALIDFTVTPPRVIRGDTALQSKIAGYVV